MIHQKKSHIALIMFMVYFVSFTMHAMPSLRLGETRIIKECLTKKKLRSSELVSSGKSAESFENTETPGDNEPKDDRPLEISICPTTPVFILSYPKVEFRVEILEKVQIAFLPSCYDSPSLENLQEPPRAA